MYAVVQALNSRQQVKKTFILVQFDQKYLLSNCYKSDCVVYPCNNSVKKHSIGVCEMAWWLEVLAVKPDDLSLSPETYMMEAKN